MHDGTDSRRIGFRRKEEVKRRERFPYDEPKGSDNPRGSSSSVAKRRDALCFIRLMIEQISVPALNTCVKMLKEGDERAKALLLLALLDMQQSKTMRVNMKEPEELEPMRKKDEIRRFSNKELRLTKESMRALPKTGSKLVAVWRKSVDWKVTFVEVWTA